MVFKSTDGGNTWDQDMTTSAVRIRHVRLLPAPTMDLLMGILGDVVRFRGTSSTSPTESRHVFIGRVVFDNDNAADGWQMVPRLTSLIRPSGPAILLFTRTRMRMIRRLKLILTTALNSISLPI